MKRILFSAILFCGAAAMAVAQSSVTVRFTGQKTDGGYAQLQTVEVTNLTRGWSHTLTYPDTTLVLDPSATGIDAPQAGQPALTVYGHGGQLRVDMAMEAAGAAQVDVFDMTGRQVVAFAGNLEQGVNTFDLSLENAAAYIVRAQSAAGSASAKVVNVLPGNGSGIALSAVKANADQPQRARATMEGGPFQLGDMMSYTGHAVIDGHSYASIAVEQPQNFDEDITLVFNVLPADAPYFSISASDRVTFAPGNLQYQASTGSWRFAEAQYAYLGDANCLISDINPGWIDLFGWGTSGWNSGNNYYHPYDNAQGEANGFLYGPNGFNGLTGAYANCDWGVYNAIYNPLTDAMDPAGTWRTLSRDEWRYLAEQRAQATELTAHATVDGKAGLIILPDNWSAPAGVTFTAGTTNYTTNNYDKSQWQLLENAGAVFLPAAGRRVGSAYEGLGTGGYWASSFSPNFASDAHYFFFNQQEYGWFEHFRSVGRSVRLAKPL